MAVVAPIEPAATSRNSRVRPPSSASILLSAGRGTLRTAVADPSVILGRIMVAAAAPVEWFYREPDSRARPAQRFS